jgi:isochorismate hydrolase
MKAAFITYVTANQKQLKRAAKQNTLAVAQTVKEGRELNEAALVNAR